MFTANCTSHSTTVIITSYIDNSCVVEYLFSLTIPLFIKNSRNSVVGMLMQTFKFFGHYTKLAKFSISKCKSVLINL